MTGTTPRALCRLRAILHASCGPVNDVIGCGRALFIRVFLAMNGCCLLSPVMPLRMVDVPCARTVLSDLPGRASRASALRSFLIFPGTLAPADVQAALLAIPSVHVHRPLLA